MMGRETYEALGLGTSLIGFPSFPTFGFAPAFAARRGGAISDLVSVASSRAAATEGADCFAESNAL